MRNLDFSSWQTLLLSFVGIAVVTVIGVASRLLTLSGALPIPMSRFQLDPIFGPRTDRR